MKQMSYAVVQGHGTLPNTVAVSDRNIIAYCELKGDAVEFISLLIKKYSKDNRRKIKRGDEPMEFVLYTAYYASGTLTVMGYRKAP